MGGTQKMAELEQLGRQICELAAHISAGTARWLDLVGEFDRREGWAYEGCQSCGHWLSWRCGIDRRTAREQVRVARALEDLPLIREAFGSGELSYSKVRAITRIATPQCEAELVQLARSGTASHVEKIVAYYRRYSGAVPLSEAVERYDRRRLRFSWDHDGMLSGEFRLPPEQGAAVVLALEAADEDLGRQAAEEKGGSAEPPPQGCEPCREETARADRERRWADALVAVAEGSLLNTEKKSSSADRHLVLLHVDAATLATPDEGGRCHLEDGPALAAETARRLACDCGLVAVVEDKDQGVLDIGRKTRRIPPSMRRALRVRDSYCRFPGCTNKRWLDGHHLIHWLDGGPTALGNLCHLCTFHHWCVHEGRVTIEGHPSGELVFRRADGKVIEEGPFVFEAKPLECEHRELGLRITPQTPVAKWGGERCDYSTAIEGLARLNGTGDPSRDPRPPPDPIELDEEEEDLSWKYRADPRYRVDYREDDGTLTSETIRAESWDIRGPDLVLTYGSREVASFPLKRVKDITMVVERRVSA